MLATATSTWSFTASGASGSFAIPAPVFDVAGLGVSATDDEGALYVPDFEVALADDRTGATVTVADGMTAGDIVTVYRVIVGTQLQPLNPSGAFPAKVVERQMDRAFADIGALALQVAHSLRFPAGDDTDVVLPSAAMRANKALLFDSAGALVVGAPLTPGLLTVSTWVKDNLLTLANLDALLSLQGFGAFLQTLFGVADAAAFRTAIGAAAVAGGLAPGIMVPFVGRTAPSGFLLCNGLTFVRATYPDLTAELIKSATATISIASPAVATWNAHGLWDGDPLKFTTTGALPTGLVAGTIYYLVNSTSNTFNLATTPGGTPIITSGSQSGTHTAICAPAGDGDGSTTCNTPDWRGCTFVGHDAMGRAVAGRITFAGSGFYGASLGHAIGSETATAPLPAHTHTGAGGDASFGTASAPGDFNVTVVTGVGAGSTGSAGSGTGVHPNVQPGMAWPMIIKT